jgi:hypothetical protein
LLSGEVRARRFHHVEKILHYQGPHHYQR